MSRFDWLSEYLARLEDEHVVVRSGSARAMAPAHLLDLDPEDWQRAADVAAALGLRWCALWGDHRPAAEDDEIDVFSCLEFQGDYVVLLTRVPTQAPRLASQTPYFPNADRMERHAADLLGIQFTDHPDPRRWTRHQAWEENTWPLRADFPLAGHMKGETPPDPDYPFARAQGSGVYEIPVGPVHAGIIEPGHFRFQAVGEEILNLEQHLGYVHKGIEKLAVGRDAENLARLAGRVSGDSTVAHTFAACLAMEHATGSHAPPRATYLRALLAERERIANHLGDIGAICNDVGFAFANIQCAGLREQWQRRNAELFGHRLLMDRIVPGGVTVDLNEQGNRLLLDDHGRLRDNVRVLFEIIDDLPSLEDRLLNTGVLTGETAKKLGVTGYAGKASGQPFDVRVDSPYAPYDQFKISVPVFNDGDVAARVKVRMTEISSSLTLMDELLNALPGGDCRLSLPATRGEGIGMVDGWRGEIIAYVRLDDTGHCARFFPRDPSWQTWPALERIVLGNIVPDFPVCNKSVNGSYSGHDL